MFYRNFIICSIVSLMAMSGAALAQPNHFTFHVNDSRNNETDLCMFHRTNILDVKICGSDNGNSVFKFDMNTKTGTITQDGDKCFGLNKARLNIWSLGSKISMVDCTDPQFEVIEWSANDKGTVFTTTNSASGQQFCLAISSRFQQSIEFGDCGNSASLPIWRLVAAN